MAGGAISIGWRHFRTSVRSCPGSSPKRTGASWTIDDLQRYVRAAVESFGPERLMFGSDWPVCTLAAGYREVLDIVRTAIDERPPNEQDAILGGTAHRFWNL